MKRSIKGYQVIDWPGVGDLVPGGPAYSPGKDASWFGLRRIGRSGVETLILTNLYHMQPLQILGHPMEVGLAELALVSDYGVSIPFGTLGARFATDGEWTSLILDGSAYRCQRLSVETLTVWHCGPSPGIGITVCTPESATPELHAVPATRFFKS